MGTAGNNPHALGPNALVRGRRIAGAGGLPPESAEAVRAWLRKTARWRNRHWIGGQADAFALAGAMVVGLWLRARHLGSRGFWLDEGVGVCIARLPGHAFFHVIATREANMALYYLLLRPWLRARALSSMHAGASEASIRSLSVIAGVLLIPVVFAIARSTSGRAAAWIAGYFVAVHVSLVAYSREARGYALVTLLVALSVWALIAQVRRQSNRRPGLYVLATAAAGYAHLFAVLPFAAQAVSLAWLPGMCEGGKSIARPVIRSMAVVLAAWLPLLAFVLLKHGGQLGWVPPLSLETVTDLWQFVAGGRPALAIGAMLWTVELVAFLRRRRERSQTFWKQALLLLWLLLPIAAVCLLALRLSILMPRFLLLCAPAAVLVAVRGALRLPRGLAIAAVAALAVAMLLPLHSPLPLVREDWRGATLFVESNARPGDALGFLPPWVVGEPAAGISSRVHSISAPALPPLLSPWSYYLYRFQLPNRLHFVAIADDRAPIGTARRFWLVLYVHGTRTDAERRQMKAVEDDLRAKYACFTQRRFQGLRVLLYGGSRCETAVGQ
jgi:hypothetical protein